MLKISKVNLIDPDTVFIRGDDAGTLGADVAEIIANVRSWGDEALFEYTRQFDKCELTGLEVTAEEIDEAYRSVEPEYLRILRRAAENIEVFHRRQLREGREGFEIDTGDGIVLGQKVTPIERVGVYVPGGTAAYPSSVLMNAIPAKLAGVSMIIMATPPSFGGAVNPVILAAAKIAGVDRVFKVGGAQAIAAMAYGTETVPKVYKIVGPGRNFVAEAKRQVFGAVGIDMVAGPSEILVIADGTGDARHIAADMLSQAEHDEDAAAVFVTDSMMLAERVARELDAQLVTLPRRDIARASIENHGKIILVKSMEQAVTLANRLAPEHLELYVDEPRALLDKIKNAGSIFLGKNCPEALGDYLAGPNHTLPTMGTAVFSGPLSADDFLKRSSYTYYSKDAFEGAARDIVYFAEQEGLSGHARSVLSRLEEQER